MAMPPEEDNHTTRLIALCQQLLTERRLILASNRGPVEYRRAEGDQLQGRRGSGGVVTALSALSQYAELTWIASAMGEGDRLAARRAQGRNLRSPLPRQNLYVRFVVTPRSVYHKYYNVFCNPLLWFLQHYMWNSPRTPNINTNTYDAWQNGYVAVNRAFAQGIIAEARESQSPPIIMLHDYHLYLTACYIREELSDAILQHFVHIPWPAPGYWQLLPSSMRRALCQSLCTNDIVGFQTMRDVRNFLQTCETFLEDVEVDYRGRIIWTRGHRTVVKPYPISIDVADLRRTMQSFRVRQHEEELRLHCGEQTIVRVDRAEPSKNIVRGFRAFDLLLQRYPELVGKVKFLAFLVPTRTYVRQYQRYNQEINDVAEAINARYGREGWQPVEIFFENNYAQAIAGMRLYDVLLVNAVIDGMNLVAKEGPIVNNRDGVLVLSEAVGAHEQLQTSALSIAPTDIEGTMQALHSALAMPAEERRIWAEALRKSIEEEDITVWLWWQFEDLLTLAEELSQSASYPLV